MSLQTVSSFVDAISAPSNTIPPVSLIKHYKGTTMNQQGRIIAFDEDSATIQASQRMTFPFLNGKIHMLSGAFAGAISATIRPVDYSRGIFQISDISFSNWRDRRAERVEPKNPVYVSMGIRGKTHRAFLEDISTEGMGILANKTIDRFGRFQVGEKALFEFQLTPEHSFIYLKGALVYRQKTGNELIKMGIQLYPDQYQQTAIQDYVIQRYDEIKNELELDYIRMREQSRVENLYF